MTPLPIVLVTGSRDFTDYITIYNTIAQLRSVLGPFMLLHGGARGVDTFAATACRVQRIRVLDPVLPEWSKYGKAAGVLRNNRMLDRRPDYVLGFWTGAPNSRGTVQCLEAAINTYRVPVWAWTDGGVK